MSYSTPVHFVSSGIYDPAAEATSVEPALSQQFPRATIQSPNAAHTSPASPQVTAAARTAQVTADAHTAQETDGCSTEGLGMSAFPRPAVDLPSLGLTHSAVIVAEIHSPPPNLAAASVHLVPNTAMAAEGDTTSWHSAQLVGTKSAELLPGHDGLKPDSANAVGSTFELRQQQFAPVSMDTVEVQCHPDNAAANAHHSTASGRVPSLAGVPFRFDQQQQQQQPPVAAAASDQPNLDKLAELLRGRGGMFIGASHSAFPAFSEGAAALSCSDPSTERLIPVGEQRSDQLRQQQQWQSEGKSTVDAADATHVPLSHEVAEGFPADVICTGLGFASTEQLSSGGLVAPSLGADSVSKQNQAGMQSPGAAEPRELVSHASHGMHLPTGAHDASARPSLKNYPGFASASAELPASTDVCSLEQSANLAPPFVPGPAQLFSADAVIPEPRAPHGLGAQLAAKPAAVETAGTWPVAGPAADEEVEQAHLGLGAGGQADAADPSESDATDRRIQNQLLPVFEDTGPASMYAGKSNDACHKGLCCMPIQVFMLQFWPDQDPLDGPSTYQGSAAQPAICIPQHRKSLAFQNCERFKGLPMPSIVGPSLSMACTFFQPYSSAMLNTCTVKPILAICCLETGRSGPHFMR